MYLLLSSFLHRMKPPTPLVYSFDVGPSSDTNDRKIVAEKLIEAFAEKELQQRESWGSTLALGRSGGQGSSRA